VKRRTKEIVMFFRSIATVACVALVMGTAAAGAQTTGALPDGAAAASVAKARAKTPRPAQVVTLTNASAQTATEVVITGDDDQSAKLAKPLAAKAKASLKLPKLKGCMVHVAAVFDGEGQVDIGDFDVCKEKTIRFTD
jgi:hypothetical protein